MTKKDALLQSKVVAEAGEAGKLPKGWKIFGVPPKTVVLTCGIGEVDCPGVNVENPTQNFFYLIRNGEFKNSDGSATTVPEMRGDDLKLSGTRQDFDTTTGQPIVTMQFTDKGGDKFGEITNNNADRGRALFNLSGAAGLPENYVQHFAIVLDREIKSAPSIDWEQYPNGISGTNGAQITGIGDINEAKNLALVLQTGALPVTFVTLEQTAISATLGADSLAEAWKAAIAGLLVVALFLLIFYRVLGVVAVIGLCIYAAFLYAAILLFNVTLTLPGFAGMILTLGVAADANIVIFERVKEEYRAGKSVRAAIAAGYGKGFATIIDANVVTAITAVILFLVATAGVKGFALMLLIGTLISLLTAVAATRAILGLLGRLQLVRQPAPDGRRGRAAEVDPARLHRPPEPLVRDLRRRAGALGRRDRGQRAQPRHRLRGRHADHAPDADSRSRSRTCAPQAAERAGQGSAQIQGAGDELAGGTFEEFRIRTDLKPAEQTRLTQGLEQAFQAEASVKSVSASFGRQIAEGAILAIIVSLLLVALYIAFRFELKFAGPVMVSLVHDVLITVGIYALLGREVTTATVAAVLTVLGYSIYDTIIILDRVRENMPLMKRASFRTLANVSLWETIPRSLATTFITLLPISALYFFGGETLKDFAFALLVGIGAGAYSSIFIAAPLVAVLKEREPEYARRRDDARTGDAGSVGGLLRDAEELLAAQPTPDLVPDVLQGGVDRPGGRRGPAVEPAEGAPVSDSAAAKRERRRQRRSTRPHGRAR